MRSLLLTLALVVCASASAQVRKCEKDGKVVYSDVVCTDTTARESRVNTNANSIDHSGLRQQAANDKAQVLAAQAKEKAGAKQYKRDHPTDSCGNPIDLAHKPSARLANEHKKCMDAKVREYNRPSY